MMNLTILPTNKNGDQTVIVKNYDYITHVINTKKENVDEFISTKEKLKKKTYKMCIGSLAIGAGLEAIAEVVSKKTKKDITPLAFFGTVVPLFLSAIYVDSQHKKITENFINKAENQNKNIDK